MAAAAVSSVDPIQAATVKFLTYLAQQAQSTPGVISWKSLQEAVKNHLVSITLDDNEFVVFQGAILEAIPPLSNEFIHALRQNSVTTNMESLQGIIKAYYQEVFTGVARSILHAMFTGDRAVNPTCFGHPADAVSERYNPGVQLQLMSLLLSKALLVPVPEAAPASVSMAMSKVFREMIQEGWLESFRLKCIAHIPQMSSLGTPVKFDELLKETNKDALLVILNNKRTLRHLLSKLADAYEGIRRGTAFRLFSPPHAYLSSETRRVPRSPPTAVSAPTGTSPVSAHLALSVAARATRLQVAISPPPQPVSLVLSPTASPGGLFSPASSTAGLGGMFSPQASLDSLSPIHQQGMWRKLVAVLCCCCYRAPVELNVGPQMVQLVSPGGQRSPPARVLPVRGGQPGTVRMANPMQEARVQEARARAASLQISPLHRAGSTGSMSPQAAYALYGYQAHAARRAAAEAVRAGREKKNVGQGPTHPR